MPDSYGRCLCGAIEYTASARSRWMAHCHCSLCRRQSGAAFVTWVGFDEGVVTIADPDDALRWFESTPGAQRGFCGRCGSALFFRSARWPGELHVTVASLDTPLDRTPQLHVFWDTHVDWVAFGDDGLPRRTAAEIG